MKSVIQNNTLLFLTSCSLVGTLLFMTHTLAQPTLELGFLDVGQGDATLITTPKKRQVLVDAGVVSSGVEQRLAEIMDPGDRYIDILVLTHPDSDHVGGALGILKNYKVGLVIYSGLDAGSEVYELIALEINEQKIPVVNAHVGQNIYIEPNVYLRILSPHESMESLEPNDYSVVIQIVYKKNRALLMADATKYIEHDIVKIFGNELQSDILKVGHHGSQTSSGEDFVNTVAPDFGIISAGCNNRFGHPFAGVLVTLMKQDVEILTTCKEGNIVFEGNGEVWVKK